MLHNFKAKVTSANAGSLRGQRATAKSGPVTSSHRRPKRPRFERLEARLLLDATSPIISELMAVNATTLADADGDYPDWIEIHNPTDAPVVLDGWYLTDEETDRTKWRFPDIGTPAADVTLDVGEYLVVFASGKDRTVLTGPGPAELHTSFQLNGDGEYLALVQPDGVTVAHQFYPEFPEQHEDISYGITQDVTTFVPEGAPASYRVPTLADAGDNWTDPAFDDSDWIGADPPPPVLITESGNVDPDFVEIQNVSENPVNTSGWFVVVNDARDAPAAADINAFHATLWNLPGSIAPGEVLYRSDNPDGGHFWGENIYWTTTGPGWAMMVDGTGDIVDFVVWGYTAEEIASLSINAGGFDLTAGGSWTGEAAPQNVASGNSLQRTGSSDNDVAFDWGIAAETMGQPNADLVLPFPGSDAATGIGFNLNPTGFEVTTYKANVAVDSLSAAESVIGDPARQAWTATEIAEEVNYYNTGGDGHYGGNRPFPGTVIGADVDEFVIEATATVIIPSAGPWTFGANTDDGFGLQLTNGTSTFSTSYPGLRGPGDTFGVFNVTEPGAYDLRLVAFEHGGGSGAELFAAQGTYSTFNSSAFRLVGDAAGGGLMVTGFGGAIQTDVEQQMHNQNASLWTRIPFQADDPATLNSLWLRMKYNDGFVAYVNGHEIARRNAPTTLRWNSSATAARPSEQSAVFEQINVTAAADYLVAGTNVLAIHGLNVNAADDDFLILPVLIGSHTGQLERYFGTPTPGGPNSTGFLDFVADTRFSVDRGFYDAPFSLQITTDTSAATIRYTLDGTQPTESNGLTYGGPLTVNRTTTVRAAAFKTDHYPTNVDTQTYIFLDDVVTQSPNGAAPPGWPSGSINGQSLEYGMDPAIVNSPTWGPQMREALTSVPTMSLVTDLDNFFDPGSGIYVNARSDGIDWERPASLELFYPDGASGAGFPDGADDGFQIDMGVRIRGGFSRSGGNPKHALRFFFRREYGDAKLNYPLFGTEGVDRFDKVDLRTAQNYSWSFQNNSANTMNREVTARDTQGAMGQPYTRSRYYHLYINGQYWGLYQTQERSEAAYGASYFGGERQEYDTIKVGDGYNIHATDGTIDAWRRVWDLANQGFETDAKYNYIQGRNSDGTRNPSYPVLIDVDNLIDYMLIVFYDGDRDAPISNFLSNNSPNNWYGVRNRNGEEGFKFFVHDAEHIYSRGLTDRTGPFPAGDSFNKSNPQWVHQELMAHPEYRMQFADRAHKHLFNDGDLTEDAISQRFQNRADQIDMAIIAESARWGSSSRNKTTWLSALNNELGGFFPGRSQTIVNQLKVTRLRSGASAPLYPSLDAPEYNRHGGQVGDGFEVTMSAPGGTIYYTLDGSDPRLPSVDGQGGGISPTAQIYQGSTTTVDLIDIAAGSPWAYEQSGTDLGTAWRQPGYNDAGWSRGDALLYVESSSLPAPKRTPLTLGQTTYYFRKHFDFSGEVANTQLRLRVVLDDGAVVYLNGQEVRRPGMNAGAVTHDTFAGRTVTNAVYEGPFTIPADALVQGDNVIAVEVHQTNAGSSDIVFGLELEGVITTSSTPVTLLGSTRVQARAKSGSQWSALNDAQFFIERPAAAENLAITEINYNPYDPTPEELIVNPLFVSGDFEFVELRNVSNQAVVLAGVEFVAGITFDFDGAGAAPVQPGESIVLVKNPAAFAVRYPTVDNYVGGYAGQLSNGGEQIELSDFFANSIVRFAYNDAGNWPGRADGKGASLELIDPAALPTTEPGRTAFLENGNNWRSSSEYGGTPGSVGSGPIGDVVVNEVLTHTDLPDKDTIELHNTTAAEVYLGGWYLSDSWGWESSPTNGNYKKHRIPNGTSIPAGGYLVFDEDDFNPTPGNPGPNDFALNGAHGDDVWLMEADGSGNLTRFVDHVEFGAAAAGESWGRWPNAAGDLYPMVAPTLDPADGENAGPRVGPVIISELQYNAELVAEDDNLEFIEIYNTTSQPIDLTEWRIRGGIALNFPAGASLEASSTLVIVPFELGDTAKLAAFRAYYGIDASVDLLGGYTGRLDNDGERIQLQRPDEEPADEPGFIPRLLEDEVRYDDQAPWPTGANGNGDSLHRAAADAWGNAPASFNALPPTPGATVFVPIFNQVVGRHIFYNGSVFDGNDLGANLLDDEAIAPDKAALLPGETAGFANYTS